MRSGGKRKKKEANAKKSGGLERANVLFETV